MYQAIKRHKNALNVRAQGRGGAAASALQCCRCSVVGCACRASAGHAHLCATVHAALRRAVHPSRASPAGARTSNGALPPLPACRFSASFSRLNACMCRLCHPPWPCRCTKKSCCGRARCPRSRWGGVQGVGWGDGCPRRVTVGTPSIRASARSPLQVLCLPLKHQAPCAISVPTSIFLVPHPTPPHPLRCAPSATRCRSCCTTHSRAPRTTSQRRWGGVVGAAWFACTGPAMRSVPTHTRVQPLGGINAGACLAPSFPHLWRAASLTLDRLPASPPRPRPVRATGCPPTGRASCRPTSTRASATLACPWTCSRRVLVVAVVVCVVPVGAEGFCFPPSHVCVHVTGSLP